MIEQAYVEVSEILNHLNKDLYSKIPTTFINFINNNKDSNYKPNLDFSKNINDQSLLNDTRTILSIIYRDYLCTPEKKKELLDKDRESLEKEKEKDNLNKNNIVPNDVFNNIQAKEVPKVNTTETSMVVVKKENWLKRLFHKIFKK